MTVRLVRGARWASLVDHLAEQLSAAATDPFLKLRVVVATRATGRVVGQQVASRLGISAGIDYLSPTDLMRNLAERAGVARDRSRWRGTSLDLAVAEALGSVTHPLVQRALAEDASRPGRRRATAMRIARMLRLYLDAAPELLAEWMAGSDAGLGGTEIPDTLSWQPGLLRTVTSALELDPLATLAAIGDAARTDATPTFVLAVDHLTAPQLRTMEALAQGPGLTVLQPVGAPGAQWSEEMATDVADLADEPAAAPHVTVHHSHGEARQVEVLRDELTRAFAADPTLEPRDVVVVCPRPERYAGLLDAAFAPGGEGSHPGRTLRLQPLGALGGNPVLELLVRCLRLGFSRATASEVVELLLSPAIAHRWRLTDRRAVIELVSGAGIRWGLDSGHRATFDLADVEQNTWARGIDRLLIGLVVAPGVDAGLGLSGSEAVTASDLTLVGALCEVLARLRQVVTATTTPATVAEWVARVRAALETLVGLPYADQWQELHALAVLARFEADHQGDSTTLTPHEFTHLLEEAATPPRARVAAGNGALQVIPLGELQHVEYPVVAMLGITDDVVPGRGGSLPDAISLGDRAPDLPRRRLQQLLLHARSAQRLIIVQQARSQRTNDAAARPVAVSWLLQQLGEPHEEVTHPPTPTSEANFRERPSFDVPAHAGAQARRAADPTAQGPVVRRRQQARRRAIGPAPAQVTLTQLERFLSDPAKTFLRAAGGIALYAEPAVDDEMPLEVFGLEKWRLVNALVDSWKDGTSLTSVEDYFREREDLPPQAIGDAAFEASKQEATELWRGAWGDWSGTLQAHAIDLTLDLDAGGQIRLIDEVRTRNGLALAANPSQKRAGIIRPWLESLALAAQGVQAPAKLHYFVKNRYANWAVEAASWLVDPPTAEAARAHLTTLAGAYAQGQHRLLPVPATPALAYAREHAAGKFSPVEWSGPIKDFRGKWSDAGAAWLLFYSDDVGELLEDVPLPEDPQNGQPSAFQAWAWELYAPLMGGGGA